MKIAFVLPGFTSVPVGGYKVVFEYANRLVAHGHEVSLFFPRYLGRAPSWDLLVHRPARALLRGRGAPQEVTWFPLDRAVRQVTTARLHGALLAPFDAVVATGWSTAEEIARVRRSGQVVAYLIQNYETHWGPPGRVEATWRLPFIRVVVSRWLAELAEELGALPVCHIPNAVDVGTFRCDAPTADRSRRVVMMWHPDVTKGGEIGLEALARVKARDPGLLVSVFSTHEPPPQLPSWVDFRGTLGPQEIAELLNSAMVFLSSSRIEGWCLPAAEAMACGCAVVATDSGGIRDFARHGETALLVPPDDVTGLADAVVQLLDDQRLRSTLATRGSEVIREFSWERSADALEAVLRG